MSNTAQVTWVDGMQFVGESGSGHAIVLDTGGGEGQDTGMSPMETVLVGLAGCTAIDVRLILGKKRQKVTGIQVKAEAERADEPPRVYTEIKLTYIVRGRDISEKAVADAIELSEEKYCSVSAMLNSTAEISSAYQIIQESID